MSTAEMIGWLIIVLVFAGFYVLAAHGRGWLGGALLLTAAVIYTVTFIGQA